MADGAAIRRIIQDKTGYSPTHINRLVKKRGEISYLGRDLASMAVALDLKVSIPAKYASNDDWDQLRSATPSSQPAAKPIPVPKPAASSARPARATAAPRSRKTLPRKKTREVMVVHGRDDKAKEAMFAFLKGLDLKPMEWTTGIEMTGSSNPTVQEIVSALFGKASAVVVLLTPDDEGRVRAPFRLPDDPLWEVDLTPQARSNVLFEAGMAISSHPDRTVMVQIGHVRPFTDIGGSFITRMNNSLAKRKELRTKLMPAALVDPDADDWRTAETGGDFEYFKEIKEKKDA